jgi:hypothetical protein
VSWAAACVYSRHHRGRRGQETDRRQTCPLFFFPIFSWRPFFIIFTQTQERKRKKSGSNLTGRPVTREKKKKIGGKRPGERREGGRPPGATAGDTFPVGRVGRSVVYLASRLFSFPPPSRVQSPPTHPQLRRPPTGVFARLFYYFFSLFPTKEQKNGFSRFFFSPCQTLLSLPLFFLKPLEESPPKKTLAEIFLVEMIRQSFRRWSQSMASPSIPPTHLQQSDPPARTDCSTFEL